MDYNQKTFVRFLADSGALFFEKGLRLDDGRVTPYFLDIGKVMGSGSKLEKLSGEYARMIRQRIEEGTEITTLFGPAYKGIPLATGTSFALSSYMCIDVGVVFNRKEAKKHGEKGIFVGDFPEDARVYLVDDVMTSARTKLKSIKMIQDYAAKRRRNVSVVGVGIAFDRQQVNLKGENAIESFTKQTGIPVDSIVGARDAMKFLFKTESPLMINGREQAMSPRIYRVFQGYMEKYGIK